MKLGCHVSSVMSPRFAPYEAAISRVAQLGFRQTELLAMSRDELTDYYTAARTRALRSQLDDLGLDVSLFALYSTACQGLATLDDAQREESLEVVARAMDVAVALGSPIFNFVSHWETGLTSPHPYPPIYLHPNVQGVDVVKTSKWKMAVPTDDYRVVWENYVESIRRTCALAEERSLRFAIEGHAQVIVSGADAMLRLFDQVDSPALVANLDTAWHLIMREYLPLTIRKLGSRLAHVQIRDGDGHLSYVLPPGQGITDWDGVFAALGDVGFDGVVSLELFDDEDQMGVAAETKRYVDNIMQRHAETGGIGR